MATTRPFAYNTGSTIDGTTQIGNIAIGVSDQDYSQDPGGVKWWMGPDEELGYVIANEVPTGDHPTPVEVDSYLNFWRSTSLTDQSFIDLLNSIPITNGLSLFTNVTDALSWLNTNGYFTSYSSFGSSGFQWMTVTSVTDSTASGIGQNNITAAITQSGGGMAITQGVFNPTAFPEEYGVPFTGNQIANYNSGTFTAIFSQPVVNALVAFASIGNSGLYVPIEVSAPFTPIFGASVSYQNPVNGTQYTQLTGNEGYAIIRIDGIVTGVTFNYTVPEGYCNICFGFVDQNNLSTTPTPTPTGAPTATPTPLPATSTPTPLPATATPTPTPTDNLGDNLLQENGDSLLQENGDNILLESTSTTPTPTPTPDVTSVPTDTPTPLPATSTPTPVPTDTPLPATNTPTPTPTYYYYYLLNCNLGDNKYGRSLDPDINLSGFTFNVDTNICYTIAGNDDGPYYDYDLDNATLVTDCMDVLCGLPTPTPTPNATNTPTSTPTSTPVMASLDIDIVMGYNGISFDGVTYTSDTTISVVKNQQYNIIAFNGSGLFQNWEGTNVNLPVPNSSNTIVTITGDTATLKAVFPEMTPTPTPTVVSSTATPTPTPTETPTPTPTTVASCSGKPYVLSNLLTTPSSGESLWISSTTPATALNLVNILGTNSSVLYFNEIDNDGTDQTTYFGNAVGTSFTVTLCQNGNSAIYSGTNIAMVYDGSNSSYFLDSTKLSLVQSSPVSTFTFGEVFYIGILVSGQSTPTPTPTSTTEPTNVPTDTPTPTPEATSTPEPATVTPAPTGVPTDTPTPTPLAATSTPTPQPTSTATPLPATSTPTPTPTSGGSGIGSWFFYSDEGSMNAGAPSANGNALFWNQTSNTETYNPNYTGGTFQIYLAPNDSTGTSYATQFSGLTTGGTITLSQNGDTATYTLTSGQAVLGGPPGGQFFVMNITSGMQTKTSNAPFVSGSTISLIINGVGGGTPTPTPTPGGPTSTPTPTTAPTSTPTPTSAPTSTPTPLPATATPTPSATATNTPTPAPPTATPTATPIPSNIIVAAGGVNVLSYSYDGGDNWTNSSNGATFISQPAFAVATDGNMFVAGGTPAAFGGNGLLWSNDGNTWSGSTNGSSMFTTNVRGVAYGGDKWVAVGISSGAAKFAYSYDGITWTAASNSNAIGSVPNSVAYNGSRWVAVGSSPAGGSGNRTTIAYSDDGISWTASANSGTIFTGSSLNVAWGGDKWVAVGTGANRIAYSTDGITWSGSTSGNSRITGTGYGIAYNGSQWVAAGQGTNALAYSSDGITWSGSTNGNTIFSFVSLSVAWADTKWVAGGVGGPNQLATSTDGLTWSATTNGNTIMNNRVNAIAAKY